jgi:hypothetical protein
MKNRNVKNLNLLYLKIYKCYVSRFGESIYINCFLFIENLSK